LYAARMRYLDTVMYYNSNVSENVTFFIKIIDPYGQLRWNPSSSPSGYSYSIKAQINSGSNQSLDLSGWGNSTNSSYAGGNWTIEVWYKDVRLKSEKIVIRP